MPYLTDALDSVESQTLDDFEIVVVDGGSRDGTIEACGRTDSPVRILKGGGIVDSLRRGVQNAKGTYIARVDADSVSDPKRFERQVSLLESHSNLAAVGSHALKVHKSDGSSHVDRRPLSNEAIREELVRRCPMVHPSMMIRRRALLDVGNYRDYLWEDYELLTRFASTENDYTLMNVDEVLVTVYKREESITGRTPIPLRVAANLHCGSLAIRRGGYSPLRAVYLHGTQLFSLIGMGRKFWHKYA